MYIAKYIVGFVLLVIINIIIHRIIIKNYKYNIKILYYILSLIPIINIVMLIKELIMETYHLMMYHLKKISSKKYDSYSNNYTFKKFSYGYCLCKDGFAITGRNIRYAEEEMLNKICDFDIVHVNSKNEYVFFCKTKKQMIENIEKINAYYISEKLTE